MSAHDRGPGLGSPHKRFAMSPGLSGSHFQPPREVHGYDQEFSMQCSGSPGPHRPNTTAHQQRSASKQRKHGYPSPQPPPSCAPLPDTIEHNGLMVNLAADVAAARASAAVGMARLKLQTASSILSSQQHSSSESMQQQQQQPSSTSKGRRRVNSKYKDDSATSRTGSKGLRHFSMKVCEQVGRGIAPP